MKTSVAQYIAKALASFSLDRVFLVTGGGAMFLNDALSHHPALQPIFFHHEQAASMAAEAYSRITGKPAILNVTTGPGGINALNGVFGAWTDSIPMLVLSGQVKRPTCLATKPVPGLRQLGDQEAEIIKMVTPITKYASVVEKPEDIGWQLEKALHIATTGRPGPCWLDIPIDVQSALIDPQELPHFAPPTIEAPANEAVIKDLITRLATSKRPVIMAGTGIRCSNALAEFESLTNLLGIPVVTAWTHDLVASDAPLFCGRPGTIGTRAGNFTVQNADFLLILGSRLNIRQTGYYGDGFAPKAFKVQVDIDSAELYKPTVTVNQGIAADLKPLLAAMTALLKEMDWHPTTEHAAWLAWCRERVDRYPAVTLQQRTFNGKMNPYHFVDRLIRRLDETDIIACGNATACIVPFQTAHLKHGQRMFSNSGSASMGYDLPAAIGAYYGAVASRGSQRRVVCFAGDGSIMMNLQELQTIVHHRLPIKIFVLDNNGYLSIRTSQNNFFKRMAGEGPDSGVSLPDFVAVAKAFGLPASRIDGPDFEEDIQSILDADGPYLAQVILDPNQQFEPRTSSRQLDDGRIVSAPLEDMYPFLDRDELAKNLL